MPIHSSHTTMHHGGLQALLLLGGKGVERGAKEVRDRDETTIEICLGKNQGTCNQLWSR